VRLARGHFQAFAEIARLLTRHRDLTFEMARRELADRYAGQALGLFWAVGHPVFLIGLYVFVFAFVFKARIDPTQAMPLDYTTYLLSGLVAWLGFQDILVKSGTIITGNASLVKQVVFPLEVLPVKTVMASLFPQLVSLVVLIVYVLAKFHAVPVTYALLPVLLVMQLMAMAGIAYFLSAVGVYFRDIKDVLQIAVTAGVYTLPIFYLPAWVPPLFAPLIYLNPFSHFVWCYQDALYFGRFEHPIAWLVAPTFSLLVFLFGYRFFRKLKPGLGNLL
jgi:lipopolysaccharide transport system permease protein